MPFVWREIKWHEIVDFAFGEPYVYCAVGLSVYEDVYACVIVCFLHRKQHVTAVTCYPHKCVVGSEMVYSDPLGCGCSHGKERSCGSDGSYG